jgi:hypothetical protein
MASQPTPESLLDRAEGRKLKAITKQGIGAWLLSASTASILGSQAIVELFVLTPVDVVTNIMDSVAMALIIKPLSVVITGSETSAEAIGSTFLFGLPLSVVLFLVSLFIVSMYLSERETSDLIPGTFTDFIGGTEEEANADD